MPIREALHRVGKSLHADVGEDPGGALWIAMTLAKRRAGGLPKQLRYRIGLDIDEAHRTVFFQEWLWEEDHGPRLDMAARLEEKDQAFRISPADAPGNVEQVALLFAKRYGTPFDFPQVRQRLRDACLTEGYRLRHLIPL